MRVLLYSIGLTVLMAWGTLSAAIASATIPRGSESPATTRDFSPARQPKLSPSEQKLVQQLPPGRFFDVPPTQWAFTAVNALAEDYGCLLGYPDGTFRGDQFVTRYEFAGAMDACLNVLLEIIEDNPQSSADVDRVFNDLNDLRQELGTLTEEIETIQPQE